MRTTLVSTGTRRTLQRAAVLLLAAVCGAAVQAAVPVWGDKQSMPFETAPAVLKPGQFVWSPANAPAGPIAVIVNLDEQRAYVYRNGERIGYSTVSAGRAGHATPTGIFTVLQKDKDHHSSRYNDAAMPYTERLTWDGIALHAGGVPGYPSSHGCVHLPTAFAASLFEASASGMVVVIGSDKTEPPELTHPRALAPFDAASGKANVLPRLDAQDEFRWTPERSPSGPVSVLLSSADQRAVVLRNGVEIGRARLALAEPGKPLGSHLFVVGAAAAAAGAPPRWISVAVPGQGDAGGVALSAQQMARVTLPPAFVAATQPLLVPGTTLLVTDAPILPDGPAPALTVVSNGAAPD